MKTSLASSAAIASLFLLITACGSDTAEPASPAKRATKVDACTLLTAAEIEAVTGITPGTPERANPGLNNCQWPSPGEVVPAVYIGLSGSAANSWDEYREEMIANDFGNPDEIGERIDIEVFGFYIPDSAMLQVQTEAGALMTLRVRKGSKAQLVDLAEKAAARLR